MKKLLKEFLLQYNPNIVEVINYEIKPTDPVKYYVTSHAITINPAKLALDDVEISCLIDANVFNTWVEAKSAVQWLK